MHGKRVLVGVGGGIAAYKTVALVSRLVQQGAIVDVVMTEAAQEFIRPLSFEALTHRRVHTDLYAPPLDGEIVHVAMAEAAEACVIAPATADLMAKLAHGLASDFLTTTALALRCPVLIAPAMDVGMFGHPATRANVTTLRARGVHVVGPIPGRLASGRQGLGRMSEPEDIALALGALLAARHDLEGVRVAVTAGGTQEPIDPVRFIGNRSSGKMGYAIAEAAAARGAAVTLITAPTALPAPAEVKIVAVQTTADMHAAVLDQTVRADVVVMAAAVADYRVEVPSDQKMKRTGSALTIHLVENPDISAAVGALPDRPVLVVFAAETRDLMRNAAQKLVKKGADLIVANDVTQPGSGFGTETNQAVLLHRDRPDFGPEALPMMSKRDLADVILDRVLPLVRERRRTV